MSDHTDSPTTDANPRLDIGELFVFSGERGLVLAISVNPLTAPEATDALRLDQDGLYELKIDTDGDNLADIAYKLVVAGRACAAHEPDPGHRRGGDPQRQERRGDPHRSHERWCRARHRRGP